MASEDSQPGKTTGRTVEEDYRALMTAAGAGVCETDDRHVFTYVNDRYCELIGRSREELIGKLTFPDLLSPDELPHTHRNSSSETDQPLSMEKCYQRPDNSFVWLNIYTKQVANGTHLLPHYIAVCFNVSEPKEAEQVAQTNEADKTFLLQLGDKLRPIFSPIEVMDTASQMLGEYLEVNRVSYGELSADGKVVTGRDYVRGVARLPRRFYLTENAPDVLEQLLQNRTAVATDILHEPALTEKQRQGWLELSVRAHVSVPLMKGGHLVAALGVHHAEPRLWTEAEISLIEETAQRTWAAVEQARAEEALRSSEARLAAIFAHAAVGLSEITLDGRVLRVNDELCRLLGRSREQLLTMNPTDVTHPEDIPHTLSVLSELVQTGAPCSLDKRYVRPNGEVVYANSSLTRLDDEQGRPQVILVVTVDLTQRRSIEAALEAELEDNKRLQEISTQLIPSGDVQGLFEQLITAAAEIVRADCGVIHLFDAGKNELKPLATQTLNEQQRKVCVAEDVVSNPAWAEAKHLKKRIIVTDYSTDRRFVGSHSAREFLRVGVRAGQSTPLVARSGRMVGMISTYWKEVCKPDDRQLRLLDILARQAADLIERHQAEGALRQSEERYRTLFNSIDEGFCVMQMIFAPGNKPVDFRFLEVNPAFKKQAGMQDVVGKYMRELVPGHEQHWFDAFGHVALTGKSQRFINEARQLGRWYDVYAFRFGDCEKRHVAALFSDVTDRIQAEAELKQADRRKNEFLAMLAHELRNPLAPLRAGLDVLRMSGGKRKTSERILELMDRQMQQMVRLVDDLLDWSRITQGKVYIHRERICLQSIVENAVDSSRPIIDASGVTLHIFIPSEPVEVNADSARLAQVLSNLLNNAAKFTDVGGKMWLEAEVHDKDVLLKVCDTGTGIPPDMLNSIFDAFTQADNTLARSRGGLGVGLSLVKTLVELHGGTVSAHSEGLGKGSEFVIHLPDIAYSREENILAPPKKQMRTISPHKVLVVDDNIDAADALATMLRLNGDEVEVAHSGPEGLSLAEQLQPHLVLLDLGMPELDGYEVARRIRAQPWGQSIVISALTGWGQNEDRQRSRDAGFDYHLVKPVDLNILRSVLETLPAH